MVLGHFYLNDMVLQVNFIHVHSFPENSVAESSYDVGNKELLSIKAALDHLFQVITVHNNVEYIKKAKRLNSCQTLWALFFLQFNFTVIYRPGCMNSNADAYLLCMTPPTSFSF